MDETAALMERALDWLAAGRAVAIATVVAVTGSTPRPLGSRLIAAADGCFEGSVSGGCVEGAVIETAQQVIPEAGARTLKFHAGEENPWSVGLACGGDIVVRVECLTPALADLYRHMLSDYRQGRTASRSIAVAAGQNFVETWTATARLLIVGAVHIAQKLAQIALLAEYGVTIIDPRSGYLNASRFPEVELSDLWPDEAIARFAPDKQTAIITLTHDPKLDDPALVAALASDAFYVGALGSRKTQAARLERLRALGLAPSQLERIHGPVGLDIGGVTPAEIAISILAGITAARRADRLRSRRS